MDKIEDKPITDGLIAAATAREMSNLALKKIAAQQLEDIKTQIAKDVYAACVIGFRDCDVQLQTPISLDLANTVSSILSESGYSVSFKSTTSDLGEKGKIKSVRGFYVSW